MTGPFPLAGATAPSLDDGGRCPQCGTPVHDAWLVCAACGTALAVQSELAVGFRLAEDRFEVRGVLGRGGFGITYDVLDRRLQRRVAVKELFPESAVRHRTQVLTPPHARTSFQEARDRFLREAQVLARFNHPGIVRVYEVFEANGTAYLVMELLEGRTLVELLRQRKGPFDESEVLDVANRVGQALRPLHLNGILHRDVNPSNIVMTDTGRVVLIDFGLARDFQPHQTMGMTRVVTPGYAPLEQYTGNGRFGPATDVYGLAATLYRLTTAQIPASALDRQGGAEVVPPHRHNPAISKRVSDAILDGLELQPGHRPATVDAFIQRLGIADPPRGHTILLTSMPAAAAPGDVGAVRPPVVDRPHPFAGAPVPLSSEDDQAVAADRHRAQPDDHTEIVARRSPAVPAPPVAAAAPLAAPRPADAAPYRDRSPSAGPTQGPFRTAAHPGPAPPSVPAPVSDPRLRAGQPATPLVGHAPPPGSRRVLAPLLIAGIILTSAAPVAMSIVIVLLVLPALATYGDWLVHRARRLSGTAERWMDRSLHPTAASPVRFVANVVRSVTRSVPTLALGVGLVGAWYGLDVVTDDETLLTVAIRAIGLIVAPLLLIPGARGSRRFLTAPACDHLVRVVAHRGGRLSQRLIAWWLVCALGGTFGLWLTADLWPLNP